MYQSKILGEEFHEEFHKEFHKEFPNDTTNINIILCCSFLQRTQLTGLLLLYYAGIELNEKMKTGMIDMLVIAITKYLKATNNIKDFDPTQFLQYAPLGEYVQPQFRKKSNTDFINFLIEIVKNLQETGKLNDIVVSEWINNFIIPLIGNNDNFLDDNDKTALSAQANGLIGWKTVKTDGGKKRRQTKKQRVMKSKKVRRVKKHNKKSKKVKRRSNKRKA